MRTAGLTLTVAVLALATVGAQAPAKPTAPRLAAAGFAAVGFGAVGAAGLGAVAGACALTVTNPSSATVKVRPAVFI